MKTLLFTLLFFATASLCHAQLYMQYLHNKMVHDKKIKTETVYIMNEPESKDKKKDTTYTLLYASTYDEHGNISAFNGGKSNMPSFTVENSYDESGRLLQATQFYNDHVFHSMIRYKYDAGGKLVEKNNCNKEGAVIGPLDIYENDLEKNDAVSFNKKGQAEKEKLRLDKCKQKVKYEYRYNDAGQVERMKIYQPVGTGAWGCLLKGFFAGVILSFEFAEDVFCEYYYNGDGMPVRAKIHSTGSSYTPTPAGGFGSTVPYKTLTGFSMNNGVYKIEYTF